MKKTTQKIPKAPSRTFYKRHLKKYAQYSQAGDWLNWCSGIAYLRGMRTVHLLDDYVPRDARILDLGCGIGLSIGIVAQVFPNTTGCDIGIHEVRATKEMLKEVGLRAKVDLYDGIRLPYKAKSFDAVTNLEVVEHAPDVDVMLAEIARVLKPKGVLIITTANKWWPLEPHFKLPFLSYLPMPLADVYVRLAKKGSDYDNIKLPSYTGFRAMVEKYFTVEDVTLAIIENFEKYDLDKERGGKVAFLGQFLRMLSKTRKTPLQFIDTSARWLLVRVSLGWVFVARPRKRERLRGH